MLPLTSAITNPISVIAKDVHHLSSSNESLQFSLFHYNNYIKNFYYLQSTKKAANGTRTRTLSLATRNTNHYIITAEATLGSGGRRDLFVTLFQIGGSVWKLHSYYYSSLRRGRDVPRVFPYTRQNEQLSK